MLAALKSRASHPAGMVYLFGVSFDVFDHSPSPPCQPLVERVERLFNRGLGFAGESIKVFGHIDLSMPFQNPVSQFSIFIHGSPP
jgi:hypothetical protein